MMISIGVMEWAIYNILAPEGDECCVYSKEYGTALLMNLSLRLAGKVRLQATAGTALAALCNLIESENYQVRTYINGTLYSLLSRKDIRAHAHNMHLPSLLTRLCVQSPEPFQNQVECVLQQLNLPADQEDDNTPSDDEGDDSKDHAGAEDEDVQTEEEVDELDGQTGFSHVRGEALLCSKYLLENGGNLGGGGSVTDQNNVDYFNVSGSGHSNLSPTRETTTSSSRPRSVSFASSPRNTKDSGSSKANPNLEALSHLSVVNSSSHTGNPDERDRESVHNKARKPVPEPFKSHDLLQRSQMIPVVCLCSVHSGYIHISCLSSQPFFHLCPFNENNIYIYIYLSFFLC